MAVITMSRDGLTCLRVLIDVVDKRRTADSLGCRPAHDRYAADAVLRAAFDEAVAVGHVDQHVALTVEEADDLKCLEDEAAPLGLHV